MPLQVSKTSRPIVGPSDHGVDQVPLKKNVMLGSDRKDDRRILTPWDL